MITYPNLYHLRYFVDAVELGSISAAAQRNLVTHPAVSRAIQALESHLELRLLEHGKKVFKVTSAGQLVARQAALLLESASGFNQLRLESQGRLEEIAIGISRTLAGPALGPLITEVHAAFPAAKVHVRFGTAAEIAESVVNEKTDLGFTIGIQKFPTLKQLQIGKGKFVLIESSHASGERLPLDSKRFLLTEPKPETEALKKAFLRHYKVTLPVFCEAQSWDVIAQMVQQGLGIGLVPDFVLKNWRKEDIRILRSAWFDCDYEIFAHHRTTPGRNRVLQHLLGLKLAKFFSSARAPRR